MNRDYSPICGWDEDYPDPEPFPIIQPPPPGDTLRDRIWWLLRMETSPRFGEFAEAKVAGCSIPYLSIRARCSYNDVNLAMNAIQRSGTGQIDKAYFYSGKHKEQITLYLARGEHR